jgi:hypothetical protein
VFFALGTQVPSAIVSPALWKFKFDSKQEQGMKIIKKLLGGIPMNKMTKNILIGSAVTAGSAALATAVYKKKQKDDFEVDEDVDLMNNQKYDKMESVDADKTDAEKGLTELDHTYREEWQANGFPQTHMEMEKLKEESNDDK